MATTTRRTNTPASSARKRTGRAPAPGKPPPELPPPMALPGLPTESSLKALARQLQMLTSSVLSMAGTATDLGVTLAKSRLTKPQHKAAVDKARKKG